LAFGQGQAVYADAVEEFAQRRELRRVRTVMHPVHAGTLQALQLLGRRDIGGDHEFLDQAMAVEALARLDARDPTSGGEQDPPFRQVEVERPTALAGALEGAIGAIERSQDVREER